jgi:hypothetical protein
MTDLFQSPMTPRALTIRAMPEIPRPAAHRVPLSETAWAAGALRAADISELGLELDQDAIERGHFA